MDQLAAANWNPPAHWQRIEVIDSHTGGEPFRVVVRGLPEIPGETVLEKRRFAIERLDHVRRALMWEPRGHADMYGGWLGPPTTAGADLSVLFLHNEGFSTMCGHGIIALAKVAIDTGMVPGTEPETVLAIDTPAGLVRSTSNVDDGSVTSTRFENVTSFAADLDASVTIAGRGLIEYDLGFGGAFYAVVDAKRAGVDLDDSSDLIRMGRTIKEAINLSRTIEHPVEEDLGFLYGVIFTGEANAADVHSRNVCVFADGEVDRSPTGTGVSARLAILHARGEIGVGDPVTIESITSSRFTGRILRTDSVGSVAGVVPEIEGSAHITGRSEFWFDPDDVQGEGFLVR